MKQSVKTFNLRRLRQKECPTSLSFSFIYIFVPPESLSLLYRVILVVVQFCWVDLDLRCTTILLGQ